MTLIIFIGFLMIFFFFLFIYSVCYFRLAERPISINWAASDASWCAENKTAIKTAHQQNETTAAATAARRQQRRAQRKWLLSQQHKKRAKRSAKRQKLIHTFENKWIDLYFKQYWSVYNTSDEKNHTTTKHHWIHHTTRGFSAFGEKNFKCRFKFQFKMTNLGFKHNTKNDWNICDYVF